MRNDPLVESTDSMWRPRAGTSSAGRNTERAVRILDEVLMRAAVESLRGVHVARAALCALFVVRELVINHDALATGHPRHVITFVLLVVGVIGSLGFFVAMERVAFSTPSLWWGRMFGALIDSIGFFVLMLCIVRWPDPDYHGLWSEPWPHVIALIVASAGLRLERAFVIAAGVANLASFVLLAVLDRLWNGAHLDYGADELTFQAVTLVAATAMGLIFAARVRTLALRGARRAIEAARAREKLGAYVGKAVADEALLGDDIVLGGQRQTVAVLFSDLRGFTTTAESLSPEELVVQLNAYLEEMVRVIDAEGGVVDKYIGDGIMAVFGAPKGAPDDAARALRAARAMQDALAKHNEARARRGQAPLEHGVGVHYGACIAGNIGTREHAQYTVVGDVVNVASRLESMTKEQGAHVLVSRDLLDAARSVSKDVDVEDAVPFGTLAIRGRSGTIEVFALKER